MLPVFVFDRAILDVLDAKDDARVTFLHDRVTHLDKQARENGGGLWVEHGHPMDVLASLCDQFDVVEVHTESGLRTLCFGARCEGSGDACGPRLAFHPKDHVVKAPGEVTKPDGLPYTVFTPYSKRWHANLVDADLEAAPSENHLNALTRWDGLDLPSLQEMGFERSAIEAPEAQVDVDVLKNYADTRDLPAKRGTTRISVHLRFGTVSIRELAKLGFKHSEKWLTELIGVISTGHHLSLARRTFRPYDRIPAPRRRPLQAWKAGKTGYPFGAGMREERHRIHAQQVRWCGLLICKHCCWIGGWAVLRREVARL